MVHEFLKYSDRIDVLPVLHGSGDVAVRVREELFRGDYDCLAVPLPATLAPLVMEAIDYLPAVTAVIQPEPSGNGASYVPIDPCQPVIAGLRFAQRERMAVEFIDLETSQFEPSSAYLPDPYALKEVPVEKFSAAILPALPRPPADSQLDQRVRRMAFELHRLELDYERILFLPSLLDWPWIREAYQERRDYPDHETFFTPSQIATVAEETLAFFLGELPFVTALYERARSTLDPDENLSIDGVKELILVARDRWQSARKGNRNWLSPKLLGIYFQYVRNLTLLGKRMTPDLYTLVMAAKQVGGDTFALNVLETARDFPVEFEPAPFEKMKMGIDQADLPGEGVLPVVSRLPGPSSSWRPLELKPEPPPRTSQRWEQMWDPYRQCSWPAEDARIESFHTHVREQAQALLGADLARSEKFTTSVKDGIDIRETLRNWHSGDLYVKEIPPTRGGIEVVVFLFDVPADPDKYAWRTTWHAEHAEESTIGLFATDFRHDLVGPGIGRANYGGVFFLYPPRMIPDIWSDPRIPRTQTLEERLLAAALLHSGERHVAVIAPCPLKASWRRLARRLGKRLLHIPLSRFSGRMIDRLRIVHVLNGKEVRSYAAAFIRGE
ncbi:hypothetical protein Pan216_43510 [Planctomycetes bacterium Pan216]|uniref:Uncharacterized protein n=1 Tax=Kolteria novifilia TaxID=2527975 RepID=A0A518B924_9BACT|nr:hypothetical protein Pan216_43510 [Planctomycetes bacterium Pan216]